METWNTILNTALLGTEKRGLRKEELPPVLHPLFERPASAEDLFLQSAAAVYNLRQCGFVPVRKEGIALPQAEAEVQPYASDAAHLVLKEVLETGSASLLRFWLEHCFAADVVVQPDAVPLLLEAGTKTKSLRSLCGECCGKRGEWLSALNPDWTQAPPQTDEALWQTGTLAQRKEVLQRIRLADATAGREALQQIWSQESAATKADLLEALKTVSSGDDVVWLESLLTEKSAKVKDAALDLLKRIPQSSIIQQYWAVLSASVKLTTTKGLLGIGSKQALEVELVPVDPNLFKTGIQQLSGGANITDEEFTLYQLVRAVPPLLWESHFGMDKSRVIQLLSKEKKTASWLGALGMAAVRFNDLDWLRAVIKAHEGGMHSDAFVALPQPEAEAYALGFLADDNGASSVLHRIEDFPAEWSFPFAEGVLRYTAKNPYQYNRGWYNNMAYSLPFAVAEKLEGFAPKEEYLRSMWTNIADHIKHLTALKQQIIKAFSE